MIPDGEHDSKSERYQDTKDRLIFPWKEAHTNTASIGKSMFEVRGSNRNNPFLEVNPHKLRILEDKKKMGLRHQSCTDQKGASYTDWPSKLPHFDKTF